MSVRVPHDQLQPETLRRVIESFVGRQGTDYGAEEVSLDDQVADVVRQLEEGEVAITYEARTETINIVPARKLDLIEPGSHGE